ncbi:J domain-containing protein, partial [Halorubrum sp. AD140]|uniref:J domain-containing protein n=1 Tax=Halorubrum sp. AD140 TaxID=3050073 RepID=UPI002ACD1BEE
VAVPFSVVSYFLWYHASGKLRERVRREATRAGPAERERARRRARTAEHRRSAYRSAGATDGGFDGRATGARGSGGFGGARAGGTRDPRDRAPSTGGPSEREAYATLGLDRTADQETVRATYRERAKRLHPDGEDGDEEAFKELNEAYEVLRD